MQGDFDARHGFEPYRPYGLALRRTVLDGILLQCAREAGCVVREGCRVVDLVKSSGGRVNGVDVQSVSGGVTSQKARLVIGADGLRSVVARKLHLTRQARGVRPRRLAIVTHMRGIRGLGGYGEMHVRDAGYLGIARVGGSEAGGDPEANVALVVPWRLGRSIGGDPARFLHNWVGGDRHLAPRFASAEQTSPLLATGPFASRVRRAWAPGAALVGDAADFFDPFTGEGIYAALRGGELLAPIAIEALEATSESMHREALASYEAARRAVFGGKWMVERLVGAAVASAPLMNGAVRAMARHKPLGDLLVGVAGDFVPASAVLSARFALAMLAHGLLPSHPFGEGTAPAAPVSRANIT
jgi:flavin-dependent dehydrogenase